MFDSIPFTLTIGRETFAGTAALTSGDHASILFERDAPIRANRVAYYVHAHAYRWTDGRFHIGRETKDDGTPTNVWDRRDSLYVSKVESKSYNDSFPSQSARGKILDAFEAALATLADEAAEALTAAEAKDADRRRDAALAKVREAEAALEDAREALATLDAEVLPILAARLGREHGRNAGAWVADGNSSAADCRAVIDAAANCELETPSPLSGEWADGMTAERVLDAMGVHEHDSPDVETVDAILDAYEDGYRETYEDEAVRTARAFLPDEDDDERCPCGRAHTRDEHGLR